VYFKRIVCSLNSHSKLTGINGLSVFQNLGRDIVCMDQLQLPALCAVFFSAKYSTGVSVEYKKLGRDDPDRPKMLLNQ
jgi:hypothetical protein